MPLTEKQLCEIEAELKAATPGPYFVGTDSAVDCPDHAHSGLALVDTGRESDWPIARLCEWPTARFIAGSWTNISALLDSHCELQARVSALQAENERLRASLDEQKEGDLVSKEEVRKGSK